MSIILSDDLVVRVAESSLSEALVSSEAVKRNLRWLDTISTNYGIIHTDSERIQQQSFLTEYVSRNFFVDICRISPIFLVAFSSGEY